MFESKYSKFLTVLIVIIVIALIGLIGFLGYDYYQKMNVETGSAEALKKWEDNVGSDKEEDKTVDFGFDSTSIAENKQKGTVTQYEGYNVMGKIEIPKTNIKYPILEKVTKKSIEVAVAILYTSGEGLNQPGNTVIIGHNYRNGTFFSDNYKLNVGDIIKITDNTGTTINYEIYEKFETTPEDTSFMTKDTEGRKEIALSTCTDDVQQRLILLAKEK